MLSQYLANLTEPLAHIESHILAEFIPVPTKLCMQGLKFSDLFLRFYERFYDFRTLRIMGKCTSRHLFSVRWISLA